MQTIHLGTCLTKPIDISLKTLLLRCLDVLDESERIKEQFKKEFPYL